MAGAKGPGGAAKGVRRSFDSPAARAAADVAEARSWAEEEVNAAQAEVQRQMDLANAAVEAQAAAEAKI
jgi:hypothetical protein